VGNWGYLLGTVSLIVEGSFVVLAVICLIRIAKAWQPNSPEAGHAWSGPATNATVFGAPLPGIRDTSWESVGGSTSGPN
jgi:hypothetical protein